MAKSEGIEARLRLCYDLFQHETLRECQLPYSDWKTHSSIKAHSETHDVLASTVGPRMQDEVTKVHLATTFTHAYPTTRKNECTRAF